MTALKTALFILLVPGSVLVVFPFWLVLPGETVRFDPGLFRWLAVPLWITGVLVLCWCAVDFVRKGRGTPMPVEPPKELVAEGLYRYVRNPMYVGVLLTAAGHPLWFGSLRLAVYVLLLWLVFHIFVTAYEEPHLRRTFGVAYEDYSKRVPRWIPRF